MVSGTSQPETAGDYLPWEISGTYLEACNCDSICPCRTIDGKPGGRSTHGVCMGALSWQIESGQAGGTDVAGLLVVLTYWYSDDESGSPWSMYLYVDDRGSDRQREALGKIYLGQLGGTPAKQFPWVWKASNLLGVRAVPIELDHALGRGRFRAGRHATLRIRAPYEGAETVTCVIPGHRRSGREQRTDLLEVDDAGLGFEFEGVTGYQSTFAYSSAE